MNNSNKITIAALTDFNKIRYNIFPKTTIASIEDIKVFLIEECEEGTKEIELEIAESNSINKEVSGGTIILKEMLDITQKYDLEIKNYGRKTIIPREIFDTPLFKKSFTYNGDDLGAVVRDNETTIKLWAPTASKVTLNLFKSGHEGEAYEKISMNKAEYGVWSYVIEENAHGVYYTFEVKTSEGLQETIDPYAKSSGVNSKRSMIVDLSKTNPDNWDKSMPVSTPTYTEAIIWEVHVRDFSNKINSSKYKGKYLAFTEKGLTNEAGIPVGLDYIINLGITHVHLMPVFDYATVDEEAPEKAYNWGYDPVSYNVPEGSYSTDPYNGEVRIREFKQMVQALHDNGIGVIMDVVYNHTYDFNSSFNKTVPYYYYRYTKNAELSNASGCGNDTASERIMFRRFMLNSVKYWAKEYKLDGFRFDLMGLHDLETMKQIEKAVHQINPKALIYGEGWNMGFTMDGSQQANQFTISQIEPEEGVGGSISVFNDAIRDGLKGSVFDMSSKGYISGAYHEYEEKIKFGLSGGNSRNATGWSVKNASVINYMSAHDNRTLWDKLSLSNSENTKEERLAMNRLGAAIIMLSKGTPFMQAGEEMLRTKNGEENSYNLSDDINNIDWEVLKPESDEYKMMLFYKGLIEIRKNSPVVMAHDEAVVEFGYLPDGGMMTFIVGVKNTETTNNFTTAIKTGDIFVVINPTENVHEHYFVVKDWKVLCNGDKAGIEPIETIEHTLAVPPRSVGVVCKI